MKTNQTELCNYQCLHFYANKNPKKLDKVDLPIQTAPFPKIIFLAGTEFIFLKDT